MGTTGAPSGASTLRGRDTGKSLRRRSRDESGSILVMVALFMTMFLLLAAVVIDVGYWWVNGKKAQIAADACALAAAQSIPDINPTSGVGDPLNGECVIEGTAPDYVFENLPEQGGAREPKWAGTEVEWPYVNSEGASDSSMVEATVHMKVGTFFGRIIGVHGVELTRRAVAERLEGVGDYAIYSHSGGCPEDGDGESLQFNGSTHWINGRVHSNGQYLVNNGGAEPFWAKVGTRVDCVSLQPTDQIRFGGDGWSTGQTRPDTVPPQNWPEWFTPDQFGWSTCSGALYSGQKIEIDDTTLKITGQPDRTLPIVDGRRTIPAGVYCATELFKIGGNNLVGNITALAPKIEVGGNNHDLTAFAANKVLFFSVPNIDLISTNDGAPDGNGALTCSPNPGFEMNLVNGNGGVWKGKAFHPCGRVLVNGDSTSTIEGAIYGLQVKVNGNGFNMTGNGGSTLTKDTALVE